MQGSKLFVGNLSYSVDNIQLQDLFAQYGTVKSVNIIPNKGFGFVEMSSPAEAEAAAEALNLSSMDGRNINVNEAKPQKEKPRRTFGRY
ncbi:MAG: RNA-binding protein [Candidatus Omnitrophica bacterium]|nr:RNA-binding protein [Candidatus Omnitrophota bacterium]MDD5487900.1 RNA-binding protein [Candidatus Omnitrophota bacterium]